MSAVTFTDEWRYRIEHAETAIERKADKDEVQEIKEELRAVRRALTALMSAIVGSAVLVSLTLLVTIGAGH